MENSEINKIVDIRQSPEWGEYLKWLGWQKQSLDSCKNLYFLKLGFLTIAKMQRPSNLSQDDLQQLDDLAKIHKWAFIKLEPSLDQGLDDLDKADFKPSTSPLSPPSTIFIDLVKSTDDLWTNLSPSVKYSINRAKREGGIVETVSKPTNELLTKIHPIIVETAKSQKFPAPSMEDLIKKRDLWQEHLHLAVVKDVTGEICGLKIFLGFNGNVWYMHGGTSSAGRKTKSGYLLLWESILHLKSRGYKFLDLEGKDDKRFPAFTKGWGGFSHFKERFGGTEAKFPYPHIKYYSKSLKLLAKLTGSMVPL